MHIGSEPLGFLNETPQLVSKVLRHLFPLGMELQQPTSHVPSCSWRHTATRCWTYPGSLFSLPCRSRAEAPRPINKALPLSPTIRGPKPILRCQAHMDCHAQPEPSHSTRGPERRLLPGPREAEAAPSLGAATLTPLHCRRIAGRLRLLYRSRPLEHLPLELVVGHVPAPGGWWGRPHRCWPGVPGLSRDRQAPSLGPPGHSYPLHAP